MTDGYLICDICQVNPAVGFLQYYYKDTGATIDHLMGPNVCDPCSEAMCDEDDVTKIE